MKLLIKIFLLWFLSIGYLSAQNEDTDDDQSAQSYTKQELKVEENKLLFTDAFINAVKERSIENYDKAIEYLSRCEKIYPDNTAMLYQTAENYLSLDQPGEARLYCERALKNNPDNYWLLDLSARIYEKVHDGDKAIEVREHLYTIKPSEAEKLLRLYYIYKHEDKGKKLLLETHEKGIYVINHKFYEKRFFPTTEETAESPQQKEKLHTTTHNNSPGTFKQIMTDLEKSHEVKDYTTLLNIASDALALYPAQAEIYYYKGLALNGLQQYSKALTVLEDGLDFLPAGQDFKKLYFKALIQACKKSGNNSKAEKYNKMLSP